MDETKHMGTADAATEEEILFEEEMLFIDDEAKQAWRSGVESSPNPYVGAIYAYAERWASRMQHLLAQEEGATVEDVAPGASHDADTDGITGFQYNLAVVLLAQAWAHGEELRQWHNAQYGHAGEDGIVNSALLTVG